jgi:DNA polymerase IV
VSYNRSLAKLASDHLKPDGLFVITPNMGPIFVEDLPVGKFHGVGPVTAWHLHRVGSAPADARFPGGALVGPALLPVLASFWEAYTKSGQAGRTVTVKVKFADFLQITRGRSLTEPIASRDVLDATSLDFLPAPLSSTCSSKIAGGQHI